MKENTKNLCAQIPESLHSRVRTEQEKSGMTLSEYVTKLITEYYEVGGIKMAKEYMRTLALQVTAEFFDEVTAYVKAHGLKKNAFIIEAIRRAMEEAAVFKEEDAESSKEDEPKPSNRPLD